jgi:chondroitin AC lyase
MLVLTLFSTLAAAAARAAPDPTLATMTARLAAQTVVQPQFLPYWDAQCDAILALMAPNGSFTDIDYHFSQPALWPAYNHSKRVEWLTAAWITPGSKHFGDAHTLERTLASLDYWLAFGTDFKQANWWWWTIGIPITLGISTNILAPHLLPNQTAAAAAQLALAHPKGFTGANLVWCAEGAIYRGLLEGNATLVAEALALSFATLAVTPGSAEGIKSDGAFFQHGAQIYNGGYGASYVQGIAMMLSWTRGTPLGLADSDPRVAVYSSLALDGTQRMLTYGAPPAGSPWGVALYDVSVIGRDISRPYASNWGMQAGPQAIGSGVMPQGYGLTPALMAGVGGPRAAEFVAFAALLNGSATAAQGAAALLGNRVFHTADYAVHASAAGDWAASPESGGAAPPAPGVGWVATVRAASTRTLRCEAINSENKQGAHLSDGALYLSLTGYESVDAFPAWDFQRISGTTVVAGAFTGTNGTGSAGTTAAVGGASDGARGSAVLDVATRGEGLFMRRAVFFFEDLYVVLAANVTSAAHPGAPVWSTIAQRRLTASGTFTSDSAGAPLAPGFNGTLPATTWWIWEGGVGVLCAFVGPPCRAGASRAPFYPPTASPPPPPPPYLPPNAVFEGGPPRAPLRLSTAVRTGTWGSIGAESGSVSVALFLLSLELPAPVAGAAIAYAVMPNVRRATFVAAAAALRDAGGLRVVRNDARAQAVLHGGAGVMQAAVWALDDGPAPARAALDAGVAGWRAAVDAVGAFIVSAAPGALNFTAAAPAQGGAWTARLAIDRSVPAARLPAGNATCGAAPWAIELLTPPGDGRSQTASCGSSSTP